MDYLHIVSQMLMIFGVIIIGYLAARRGWWAKEMNRGMSVFVLNVTAPCLILSSVMGEGLLFETKEILQLLMVSVLNYAILIGGAFFFTAIWHLDAFRRGLLRFMLSFGNVTFIGFPVLTAIFGERAVFYGSVLTIPFNLLLFTIGDEFISNRGGMRKAFQLKLMLSPCVLAAITAVIIALMKLQAPPAMSQWFHLIGDMTIPAALIIIGATLTQIPLRDMIGNKFVYTMSALKLFVIPIFVLILFRAFGFEEMVTQVAVVLSGMPVAANGIMFCLRYGKDERLMAQGIFISTLISIFSIPILTLLL